ncbi:receptor-like serine/threonine-protein kinase SD1-8, partial [Tanacetum coccineum]
CIDDHVGSGDYDLKMDTDGFPEIIIWKNGTERYRSGAWNGRRLIGGVPEMKIYSLLSMTSSGYLGRYISINSSQTWIDSWSVPHDQCDYYKQCGPYGICDTNSSADCTCMKGFVPKIQQAWDLRDGLDGCVRSSKLDCGSDGFLKLNYMKLPESSKVFVDQTMNLTTCGAICKRNCSCAAYANMDITQGGFGCDWIRGSHRFEVDVADSGESGWKRTLN